MVGFVVLFLEHFFWILVLSKSFRETVFLAEVYFFLFSFSITLVDCYLVHCSSFALFAWCPFGSLRPSPILVFCFMAAP